MKTWHIILIFVVVGIIGMFIYLQSKKRREEEKSKQLLALLGQQQNLLNQSSQTGIFSGLFDGANQLLSTGGSVLFGGANQLLSTGGSVLQQNPALASLLGNFI